MYCFINTCRNSEQTAVLYQYNRNQWIAWLAPPYEYGHNYTIVNTYVQEIRKKIVIESGRIKKYKKGTYDLCTQKMQKKKIENMPLQERIAYGYKKVIMLMLISGLLSIIAIGVLLADLLNYVQKINASDIAVKMCRVNVNAAARNIREMALDDDEASYDDYEKTITKLLADVDAQLKIIKETGVVSEENYTEYATALSDWEDISTSIIEEIRQGQNQKGVEDILTKCTLH